MGEFVHRDLKPGNVLLHEGKWKIADFGIARFVEEATSSRTLKDFLSDSYAAPEQWRGERAGHQTDVYALGCIAFCLLTGAPPFTNDYSQSHQFGSIPAFACEEPRLRSLVTMMLRKPPDARPELSRIQAVLNSISANESTPSPAIKILAEAGASIASRKSQQLAEFERMKQLKEARDRMVDPAIEELRVIATRLWDKISSNTPSAQKSAASDTDLEISLGDATLALIYDPRSAAIPEGEFRESKWDVVTGGQIWVTQARKLTWGASLWYGQLPGCGSFRWYEMSYVRMNSPEGQMPTQCVYPREADQAVAGTILGGSFGRAFGPVAIDDEDEEQFHLRWIELLALAASNRLGYPAVYPLTWPLHFA